jgi:hypothetical protein
LANASDPRVARVSGNSVAMFRPASVVRRANTPDPTRVAPRSVATGRVAQQLVAQRRSEAARFNTRGTAGSQGQAPRSANAGARTAPGAAGRNAGAVTPAQRTQQNLARRQAAPAGRQGQQALGRNGRNGQGQVTPPPQRTRGGTPPRRGARAQQVHQYVPPSQHAGGTQAGRQSQQTLGRNGSNGSNGRNGRSMVTPPPQRTRGGTPPRAGARSQQVHQYVPPPQHAARTPAAQRAPQAQQQLQRRSAPSQRQQEFTRPSAPPQRQQASPQRQQQVMRPSAPPQRPAEFQRQGPPPQAMRQAPMRQAPRAQQAPARAQARPQQQQRRQGPPPPAGGA